MNEAHSEPIGGEAAARLIEPLTELVIRAGEAILAVNRTAMKVDGKDDGSPVTEADLAADKIIGEGLARIAPGIASLSEERVHLANPPYEGSFFLIDPLDGTKEFVAGRNEFTVNLALVSRGQPLLGLVGTIMGMISVFGDVGQSGLSDAAKLAQGISLILRATLIGLLIAIPALIAWSYFSKKVEVLAVEMEALCDDFIRRQYRLESLLGRQRQVLLLA